MTETAVLADALASNLGEDAPPLPPLVPPGAALTIDEQLAALAKQVSALVSLQSGMLQAVAAKAPATISDEALHAATSAVAMPTIAADEPRVRIVLEDNDQIPPGGQFIQVNGAPFMLVPGYEVDVPVSLLDVLDHAITSVPVLDENKSVVGYRDRLRLPYRVVRHAGERPMHFAPVEA
jgi:hypothetical protein